MILCNVKDCINYSCKNRPSRYELENLCKWSGKDEISYSDLKTDFCGFKLDFLANDNINEFVSNKIEDE